MMHDYPGMHYSHLLLCKHLQVNNYVINVIQSTHLFACFIFGTPLHGRREAVKIGKL